MKIVILSSQGNATAKICLDALLNTAPGSDFDIHLFREKGFREQTLNYALETVGTKDDVLFIGDDILLTPGWYEALQNNLEKAHILGMSMLYPQSTKVQDRGYDLMGAKSLLEPKDRGQNYNSIENFDFRFCDAVCGCFLYIKAEVLAKVASFSEKGVNRWGEFIFIAEARKAGFTCGVIGHYLHHGGVSTKNNPDKKFSSASYLVEHGWWEDIVREFVDPAWVRTGPQNHLDDSLAQLFSLPNTRILIYGAGTVAEFIINSLDGNLGADIEICSGLSEEVGLSLLGHELKNAATISPSRFDTILMTPLHMGKGLFHKILEPQLSANFSGRIFFVETQLNGQTLEYRAREISVGT